MKLGTVAIDGTKIKAQASGHRSMRLNQIRAEEERLQAVVRDVLQQSIVVDAQEDARWGKGQPADPLPLALADAERRLERLRQAKQALEEEAKQQLAEAEAAHPRRPPGRPRTGTPASSAEQRSEREKGK